MSLYLSPYLSSSLVPASTLNASVLFFLSINFITLTVFYCLYVSHIVPPSLSLSLSLCYCLSLSITVCLSPSSWGLSFFLLSINFTFLSFSFFLLSIYSLSLSLIVSCYLCLLVFTTLSLCFRSLFTLSFSTFTANLASRLKTFCSNFSWLAGFCYFY